MHLETNYKLALQIFLNITERHLTTAFQ